MTGVANSESTRFVWRGRVDTDFPAADGWTLPRDPLATQMADADQLVVLDPLSFPWEEFVVDDQDIPTVLVLRDGTEASVIENAVGRECIYRFFTPYDEVVPTVDEALDLVSRQVVPSPSLKLYKAACNLALDRLLSELTEVARTFGAAKLRIGTAGSIAGAWIPALSRLRVTATVADLTKTQAPTSQDPLSSCHAAILAFDGQTQPHDRELMVRRAMEVLPPGGSLIVLADVVSTDKSEGIAIEDLLDEVHMATGTQVALEELRSLQWPGELFSRSVLLRYSALVMALEAREER